MKIKVEAYIKDLDEIRFIDIIDIPPKLKGAKAREYAYQQVKKDEDGKLADIIIDIYESGKEPNPMNYFNLKYTFIN